MEKYGIPVTVTQKAFIEDRRDVIAWFAKPEKSLRAERTVEQWKALAMIAADCMLSTDDSMHVIVCMPTKERKDRFLDDVVSMITPLLEQHDATIRMWNKARSRLEICICNEEVGVIQNYIECVDHHRKDYAFLDLGAIWKRWILMDLTGTAGAEKNFVTNSNKVYRSIPFHYSRTITDDDLLGLALSSMGDRLYKTPHVEEKDAPAKVLLFNECSSLKAALTSLGIPH